ncbi:Heavy metal RND efflux outer membrane protein, CzcC family [Sandaracinus amylolyticus]|uniref:Heavy metal RND efflux outer membrane protein, CzcC family n=1 Tax=Sandaracinus amylolyticus TaxID=927083 RepID=A0A0F6YK20_9BACT|nr:Heavy metal RND efflux outer membrane protein, CzcC family [Sandaracinus amylolyticus]
MSQTTWRALDDVERELATHAREEDEPTSAPARAGSCEEIVARVVASHPSLDALRANARASIAEARAEGALPAPELMLEVWDFPIGDPERADREGMYMAGLAQSLPPAGALDGRARAAAEEAREALGEWSERRRELRADAAHACTDWAEAKAIDARLAAAEDVLARMSEALRARLPTSDDPLAELARVDAERARVRRMRAETETTMARAEARLAAWIGESTITIEGEPSLRVIDAVPDRDALFERAMRARGVIESARASARAAAARADAASAEASIPMFRVSATYMQMPQARAGLGASFSMTLPWLWSGEGAMHDAARARAEAALDVVAATERTLRGEIAAAIAALETARRALATIESEERPAVERALGAIAATYASGPADLLAWIDAARALRELEVEDARLRAAAAHAWIDLESAVGGPIETEVAR